MFEKERFEPLWLKYAGTSDFASFDIEYSVPFIHELMSFQL
jgi:hypothetical protein